MDKQMKEVNFAQIKQLMCTVQEKEKKSIHLRLSPLQIVVEALH